MIFLNFSPVNSPTSPSGGNQPRLKSLPNRPCFSTVLTVLRPGPEIYVFLRPRSFQALKSKKGLPTPRKHAAYKSAHARRMPPRCTGQLMACGRFALVSEFNGLIRCTGNAFHLAEGGGCFRFWIGKLIAPVCAN